MESLEPTHEVPWETDGYEGMSVTPESHSGELELEHTPVLFVHGNTRDATDWEPHFGHFQVYGYEPHELWAISWDTNDKTHHSISDQIEHFVANLLEYLDHDKVVIVSHSLGVTASRFWLHKYDRYETVPAFVGIAGANHGVPICPPKELASRLPDSHRYKPCQFFSRTGLSRSAIRRLNDKIGETPGPTEYYTIRGTKDRFYIGHRQSPELEGAVENVVMDAGHDEVRESPEAITKIHEWCAKYR